MAINKEKPTSFNDNLKISLLKDKPRLIARLQIEHKKLQNKVHKISDINLDSLYYEIITVQNLVYCQKLDYVTIISVR